MDMTIPSCPPWYVTTPLIGVGYGLVWCVGDTLDTWMVQVGIIVLGYAFLWCTSGHLVELVLAWSSTDKSEGSTAEETTAATDGGSDPVSVRGEPPALDDEKNTGSDERSDEGERSDEAEMTDTTGDKEQRRNKENRDVGTIVGKAENILLPTFILAEAYTALSVIFAAKGLVRRDDIQKDTVYYLGCTMTNVTYSVVVALGIRILLEAFGVGQVEFLNTD